MRSVPRSPEQNQGPGSLHGRLRLALVAGGIVSAAFGLSFQSSWSAPPSVPKASKFLLNPPGVKCGSKCSSGRAIARRRNNDPANFVHDHLPIAFGKWKPVCQGEGVATFLHSKGYPHGPCARSDGKRAPL